LPYQRPLTSPSLPRSQQAPPRPSFIPQPVATTRCASDSNISESPLRTQISSPPPPELTIVKLAVLNHLVPCVLGFKGCGLRNLIHKSGCRIKVNQQKDMVPGTNQRLITCSGSSVQAACAQVMIQERIEKYLLTHPYSSDERPFRVLE